MNCLVVTPHRLGIREMAERVGTEWEALGHNVEYRLAKGSAARLGSITIGVPGIAMWWYRNFRDIAASHEQYDLIWTHQPIAPVLPTKDLSFWKKVIITIHTTLRREYELVREGVYPQKLWPYYWFAKNLEAHFHRQLTDLSAVGPRYTVVSPHLREETSGVGVSEPTYIPNGVFKPDQNFKPIRSKYNIPSEATVVLNVGSLTPQKRPEIFAQHLRTVTDANEGVYVIMAGDGTLKKEVEAYSSERFRPIGYISDAEKWRWFADADVFVSLSAYEGMPVATAEALSFGLPVVLSDIPAHRHLLGTYGATGRIVNDNPKELATAITDLREQRSSVSLPEWQLVAEKYLNVLPE